jgi:hypothetical protein
MPFHGTNRAKHRKSESTEEIGKSSSRAKHVLSKVEGTQRRQEQEISKHEIRNSKQFQITKICKIPRQTSFGFGVLDFSEFSKLFCLLSLFRISVFGFRICFAGLLGAITFFPLESWSSLPSRSEREVEPLLAGLVKGTVIVRLARRADRVSAARLDLFRSDSRHTTRKSR